MTWNLVTDSSCDLRVSSFHSDSVRFETVPLRLLVGEREFLDNDQLSVPELLAAMAAEKSAASSACPSPSAFAKAFAAGDKEKAAAYVEILYNQALIIADLPLPDPARYAELVCGLME